MLILTKLQFIRKNKMYASYGNSKLFLIDSCKFCDRKTDENVRKCIPVFG